MAAYLADTNILLRVSQRQDPNYEIIRVALHSLRATGATICFTSQNLAEFWNVCTRPAQQNGYGLSIVEADRRAKLVEAAFIFLPDAERVHAEWRRLVVVHSVAGVKVHDARLVAAMYVHGITHLLTLDEQDFCVIRALLWFTRVTCKLRRNNFRYHPSTAGRRCIIAMRAATRMNCRWPGFSGRPAASGFTV